jgi:hypothetical protein
MEHTIGNLLITVKYCVHCEIRASLKKELSIQYNISQPDGSIPRDEINAWADVKVKNWQQQGPCMCVILISLCVLYVVPTSRNLFVCIIIFT